MGTSKQAGVEFQQCGKQQTLHSVQEETSVAGVPVRCGSRAVFPGSDGRTVGGLTPQSYGKQGWSRNTNKHSQLSFGAAGSKFWTASWPCVDKNFRGLPLGCWRLECILLVFFFISNAWSATLLPIECFTVFRYFVLFVQNYIARIKNTGSWMIFRCNYSAFKHLSKTCMKSSWYHSETNLISTYLINFALISM